MPASVESVGGIATILSQNEDPLNVNLRLYAKLESGLVVVDPSMQSAVMALNKDVVGLEAAQETFRMMITLDELPSEHRASHWAGLLEALGQQGIRTDPETLRLPFELLADRATRERLAQRD